MELPFEKIYIQLLPLNAQGLLNDEKTDQVAATIVVNSDRSKHIANLKHFSIPEKSIALFVPGRPLKPAGK